VPSYGGEDKNRSQAIAGLSDLSKVTVIRFAIRNSVEEEELKRNFPQEVKAAETLFDFLSKCCTAT
jgi:hypothetical protein